MPTIPNKTSAARPASKRPPAQDIPAASDDMRARLIDAAEHCYGGLGVNATNMADIAAHAEITRRTVYRYFANREEMLDAVVRREVARFWDSFHATQKRFDDLGRYLVEALIFTLKHAPTTRSHRFLFNEEVLPLVNRMYIDNRQHTLERVAVLRIIYENNLQRGGIRPKLDLIMLCEWFNRLAVSYLAAPSPFYRSEKELRALFRAMLLPVIAAESTPARAPDSKPARA
jgi:AcrR family transcriptional regulator